MRMILVATAAALLLAGCSDIGEWMGGDKTAAFPEDRPVVASVAPVASSQQTAALCAGAARWRSGDAAVQGFDAGVVQTVYQQTYDNCLTWSARR